MNTKDYKELILELIEQMDDETTLKRIYLILVVISQEAV